MAVGSWNGARRGPCTDGAWVVSSAMRRLTIILGAALLAAPTSPARAALLRPTSLTARPVAADAVELSWKDASVRELGFEVERSTAPSAGFVRVGSTARNVSTWRDAGLGGGTYYYRVRAVGRLPRAASRWSAVAQATLAGVDGTPPSTPAGLSAVAVSCARVDLAWSASTDAGGQIAAYRVRRGGVVLAEVGAAVLSATDQSVAPATHYAYTVAAIDTAGNESAASAPAETDTPLCANRAPLADIAERWPVDREDAP